jgi:uncharacterized protein YjbI with pentapeptide repeats
MRELSFHTTSLEGANLKNSDLRKAIFIGANLRNANITGAKVHGADFTGAIGLTKEQIESAIADEETKLPPQL